MQRKTTKMNTQIITQNEQSTGALAKLPAGFLVNKTTTSGREIVKPMSRADFRKVHGLKNAESKRMYAAHLRQFTVAVAADFSAQIASGKLAKEISVGKSGARFYKVGDFEAAAAPAAFTEQDALAKLGLGDITADELRQLLGK